jgi:hypothetical protein
MYDCEYACFLCMTSASLRGQLLAAKNEIFAAKNELLAAQKENLLAKNENACLTSKCTELQTALDVCCDVDVVALCACIYEEPSFRAHARTLDRMKETNFKMN